jgi:hypothetical protein
MKMACLFQWRGFATMTSTKSSRRLLLPRAAQRRAIRERPSLQTAEGGSQPRSITTCADSLGPLSGLQLWTPFRDIFVAWVGGCRIASVA